ncbi:MAG: glycosyl hydrolase family 28 protein [Tepidisphaeraceae bacterium]|jgi:alpha-L-rhamnosidase
MIPSDKRSSISDFGAVGDGKTINTAAIQKCIDALAQNSGGTVVVPEGTFLSGAIFLKPGVNLHVAKSGVLKGSENTGDYPTMNTRIEGHFEPWLPALVNADGVDHLHIGGEGTLDGSGQVFYDAFYAARDVNRNVTNLATPRPRLMFISNSRDVQVSGLKFLNSGFWNLHLYRCQNVLVDGLNIEAPERSPSTDGIDVDSCQQVTIQNCMIANNDDCIALKGSKGPLAMDDKDSPPVEHIRVVGCTFLRGQSFVTCGSEATIVRDVTIENCKAGPDASKAMLVLRLKLRTDTPQLYEDFHIRDLQLQGSGTILTMAPWAQFFDLKGHPQPCRTVRNITISIITGAFGSLANISPNRGDIVENVTLENINVNLQSARPMIVNGVTNLTVKNVRINGKDYNGPVTESSSRL